MRFLHFRWLHNVYFYYFCVMKTSVIIRFVLLGVAWIATVALLVASSERITPYLVFVIVASAIIVFVPMYKKYVKGEKNKR